MSRTAAETAAALDAAGLTTAAPTEHALGGVAESRWVAPASLAEAVAQLKREDFFYESLTCTDRLEAHGCFELLHTFNRYEQPGGLGRIALRTWIPKDQAAPSLTRIFPMAEWNEREAWELFGLRFTDHPNLTWLLLPEGTEFHPLLKSFTAPPPSEFDDSRSGAGAPAAGEGADHDRR